MVDSMTTVRFLWLAGLTLFSIGVEAADVECTVVVRSEPHQLLIKYSENPYDVTKIDFDNGYRFSGVALHEPDRLKTYTYFDSKDRYVLVHMNTVFLDDKTCGRGLGVNTVYSPRLEIDISYQCQLKCAES